MLLSRAPRAYPSRLACLNRIPIAVPAGRIDRNLATRSVAGQSPDITINWQRDTHINQQRQNREITASRGSRFPTVMNGYEWICVTAGTKPAHNLAGNPFSKRTILRFTIYCLRLLSPPQFADSIGHAPDLFRMCTTAFGTYAQRERNGATCMIGK